MEIPFIISHWGEIKREIIQNYKTTQFNENSCTENYSRIPNDNSVQANEDNWRESVSQTPRVKSKNGSGSMKGQSSKSGQHHDSLVNYETYK